MTRTYGRCHIFMIYFMPVSGISSVHIPNKSPVNKIISHCKHYIEVEIIDAHSLLDTKRINGHRCFPRFEQYFNCKMNIGR